MPLNLVDPRSGMSYFAAAQATINAAQARGITGGSPAAAYAALPRSPTGKTCSRALQAADSRPRRR